MKKTIAIVSVVLLSLTLAAQQKKDAPKAENYKFTTVKENPITSIKNQFRSGTCWCFSALSFIESEIIRQGGKEVDLSEMFVIDNAYRERAVKYVRLDGHLGFSAGSSFGDVFSVIKNHGIVPQEAFSGMNYGTELPVQAELDAVLKAYVSAIVKVPNKELTTAWKNGFGGILDAYLGVMPTEFTADGASYTPESYRDALKINVDDFVNICSFKDEELYKPHIIEVCDNWRWGSAYNVTLDEMMDIVYSAIEKGYTVAWGGDVSEVGFTREGIAVMPKPQEKKKPAAGSDQEHWVGKAPEEAAEASSEIPEELEITEEMRQDAYDRKTTTDDHGMHAYGIATDQNGNRYLMIKNSWGVTGAFDGIWYMSDAFARYKTLNVVVHKDALSKDIKKKLGIK